MFIPFFMQTDAEQIDRHAYRPMRRIVIDTDVCAPAALSVSVGVDERFHPCGCVWGRVGVAHCHLTYCNSRSVNLLSIQLMLRII